MGRFSIGNAFNMEDEYPSQRGKKYELWRRKWKCILPLYHFMECPQCGAICVDGRAVYRHRNEHFRLQEKLKELTEENEILQDAIAAICDKIGMAYDFGDSENEDKTQEEPDGYIF